MIQFRSSEWIGPRTKKVQSTGGKLVMCKIAKEILEVFEITKLDKLFKIYPDEQAALQAF